MGTQDTEVSQRAQAKRK